MSNKGYSGGYSKELNAERSGAAASGTYRAPFKPEPLLTGVIFGVFGAAAIIAFLVIVQFARKNLKLNGTDFMVLLALTLIVIVLEGLLTVTALLLVKIVRSGYKCGYTTDEERFITSEGGKTRTIYFRDVQSVHFFPRTVFGKDRGYDINVRLLNKTDETFCIVSDNYISEKTTPFYIITERLEQTRKKEVRERYGQHLPIPDTGVADLSARTQPENVSPASVSPEGDGAMLALNLSAMAAAISRQQPSGNADKGDYYIDEIGRQRPYNEIIGSGRFKVVCSRPKTTLLGIIAAAALVVIVYFGYRFIEGLVSMSLKYTELLYMPFVVGIAVLAAVFTVIIFRNGDEYTYRANGREFVVANKKGAETHIAYEHVQGVFYFYALLGYRVKIVTNYEIITYSCIDKRRGIYEKPEKLPFDIITKNIKK